MIKKNEWYNAPTQHVMLESIATTCACGSAVCALISGSVCCQTPNVFGTVDIGKVSQ